MRKFPQNWRADRFLMERICPHGIGHPDPDDPKIYNAPKGKNYRIGGLIVFLHGCDGCCSGSYE
jgi:hypothetical protein